MELWSQIYLGVVGAGGLVLLAVAWRKVRGEEQARRGRLEGLRRFDAVRTSTPVDAPAEQARERSLESLDTRFALIRRIFFPLSVCAWTVLMVVPFLGQIPATVVSLLAGAVTVVVGFAARPLVENLIAGIVISFTQPLRLGDTITIDGEFGTVEEISTTHTMIKAWDWRRYLIPNARLFEKEFVNYSIVDRHQWAYVEFWVGHAADMERVEALAAAAMRSSEHYLPIEEPTFWVMEMQQQAIKCWIAGWAASASLAWTLKHEVRSTLIRSLREAGFQSHSIHLQLDPGTALSAANDLSVAGPAPLGQGAGGPARPT